MKDVDLTAQKPRLFTLSFNALLGATFLAYAQNFLIQPVLPLLVLSLGGDPILVGAIVAVYSLPSILLRPFIGRWADERSIHAVWSIGSALIAITSLLYLIPSLLVVFAVRLFHGAGWATFNTGGHATLARSAPPGRRGEATSIYNLVIGVAQLAFPGLALLLWSAYGTLTFVVAGVLGLLAFGLIKFGPVPVAKPAGRDGGTDGRRQSLLERGAILPMAIEFLYTSAVPIYFTFLPVYALQRGIPIESIAIFFPIYGVVFVGARLFLAPHADRLGRRLLLVGSVLLGTLGMAIGLFATDLSGIILSGAFYALGASQETPASMALAIDRSDPRRVGAAMATYSVGYQLGLGVGAATFGLVIDVFGFPAPFALGVAMQLVLMAVLIAQWQALGPGARPTGAAGGAPDPIAVRT